MRTTDSSIPGIPNERGNSRRNVDLGKLKSGIIIFQKCINVYFITFSHIYRVTVRKRERDGKREIERV